MPFNQGIFPTSIHGQLSDTYGLPTYISSSNPFSNNTQTGLVLGQGWLLFDFAIVQLFKCVGAIAANAACNYQAGNSNEYQVQSAVNLGTGGNGTSPITAVNDRGGSLTVIGGINWMTTQGLASALCAASLTASTNTNGAPLGSSAVTGTLTSVSVGTAVYNNVLLLNNTAALGAYPVLLQ